MREKIPILFAICMCLFSMLLLNAPATAADGHMSGQFIAADAMATARIANVAIESEKMTEPLSSVMGDRGEQYVSTTSCAASVEPRFRLLTRRSGGDQ